MNYYKVTIQYEGTHYSGLQFQSGLKTIQGAFNHSLAQMIDGKISTTSASRTDTGVHALIQIMKVTSENAINPDNFVEKLNKILPEDIRCLSIAPCTATFRPAAASLSKEYRYYFLNTHHVDKNNLKFAANISNKLDFEEIQKCISIIPGIHDFCNFYSSGSNVKSTLRNVFQCELSLVNPHEIMDQYELFNFPAELNECYEFKIVANGFLKQMIRHLISALWKVGSGKLNRSDFEKLLTGPADNRQKWKVAPPNGLFLAQITLPETH